MRSFLRRIGFAIKLFLLLAGLITTALWCRSYFAWDIVTRVDRGKTDSRRYILSSIRSDNGELTFDREECLRFEYINETPVEKTRRATKRFYYNTGTGEDLNLPGDPAEYGNYDPTDEWLITSFPYGEGTCLGGFQYWEFEYGQIPPFRMVNKVTFRLTLFRLPFWSITLLFLAWPALSFANAQRNRSRRARRMKNQQCLHCGYDLRATPDICPECGKPAESQEFK